MTIPNLKLFLKLFDCKLLICYFLFHYFANGLHRWQKVEDEYPIPEKLSILLTQWNPPAIRVSWSFPEKPKHLVNAKNNQTQMFRVMYYINKSDIRFIQEVPFHIRNVTVDQLKPNTQYVLKVIVFSKDDLTGNSSKEIAFISPDSEPHRHRNTMNQLVRLDNDQDINVRPGEVMIVVIVLIVWMLIIFTFIKKWGKIRTLEPTRNRTDGTSISAFQQKTRFTSMGNTNIPQLHTDDSQNSVDITNCLPFNDFSRPRLNSVFLSSPCRKSSLLPEDGTKPRRYKSAEDLKSLVFKITRNKNFCSGEEMAKKSINQLGCSN